MIYLRIRCIKWAINHPVRGNGRLLFPLWYNREYPMGWLTLLNGPQSPLKSQFRKSRWNGPNSKIKAPRPNIAKCAYNNDVLYWVKYLIININRTDAESYLYQRGCSFAIIQIQIPSSNVAANSIAIPLKLGLSLSIHLISNTATSTTAILRYRTILRDRYANEG